MLSVAIKTIMLSLGAVLSTQTYIQYRSVVVNLACQGRVIQSHQGQKFRDKFIEKHHKLEIQEFSSFFCVLYSLLIEPHIY